MLTSEEEKYLRESIREVQNFPKAGINFKDITTLLENPKANELMFEALKDQLKKLQIDRIVGIDSRGFIYGNALAMDLGVPFSLVRKKGKLPFKTLRKQYALEYGEAIIEIHKDSVQAGERVIIHDDLLATGGTARAAAELIREAGGIVVGFQFLIELEFLQGAHKLIDISENIQKVITYS